MTTKPVIITSAFEPAFYVDPGTDMVTIVLHGPKSGWTATLRVVAADGKVLRTREIARSWSDWHCAKAATEYAVRKGYTVILAEYANGVPYVLNKAWGR